MPIYAYRCAACGHAKDVLQKLSDPVLTQCPACAAEAFSKQLTAAGFQLKGSGWYVTDFREGNKAPAKKDEAGAEPGAEPGDKPADKVPETTADKSTEKPADKASSDSASSAGTATKAAPAAPAPAAPASAPTAAPAPASKPSSGS